MSNAKAEGPPPRSSIDVGRLLGCGLALGALWLVAPPWLWLHFRTMLFGTPTYDATVASVRHECAITITRPLGKDELPRPGETVTSAGFANGTGMERAAQLTIAAVRTDGSAAAWPAVPPHGPRDIVSRSTELDIGFDCPDLWEKPYVWEIHDETGQGEPYDGKAWRPGARAKVIRTIKGIKFRLADDAAAAPR